MPKYNVEVEQTSVASLEIEAETPEAAIAIVDRRDFPLPPLEERSVLKGASYRVYDEAGVEVLDRS